MWDYETSTVFLGTWGWYQVKVIFFLCLLGFPAGYNILSVIFLLAIPPHQCYIPAHSNLSQDWIRASIPIQGPNLEKSSCSRYDLDLLQNLTALGVKPNLGQIHSESELGTSPRVMISSLKQEECKDGWIYSTEHYGSTVVTEFNLVCGDQWKQPLSALIYFLGSLVGCFISGQLSDWFGRKPALFGSILILSVFSFALKFAKSWAVFNVFFFMVGMGQLSIYIALLVLGSEILVGKPRILFTCLGLPFFYAAGMMALPGTACLVRNWKHLSLFMAVPSLACVPFWWLIPESPRWLVSKGHLKEAQLLLRSAALQNKVEFPPNFFGSENVEQPQQCEQTQQPEQPQHVKPEVSGYLGLLRNTTTRNITLIVWFLWFSSNVSYFGLSFNMSTLSGNPFLNYFLLAFIEIPAYFTSWLTAKMLPRRLSFTGFCLLGSLAPFLIQITLHRSRELTLFLVLLGKYAVLAAEGILHLFTGELSPTVIRNTMMSSAALFSRVGSSISPYLLQLTVFYESLPWVIVGSLSLVSILLCFFLPESFGKPLPDTIDQMQVIQKFKWTEICPQKDDGKSAEDQISAGGKASVSEITFSTGF